MTTIQDDIPLLQKMLKDMNSQKDIYRPGPFWEKSASETVRGLKTHGLANFRATRKSTPGATMSDAPALGIYDRTYNFPRTPKGQLKRWMFESNMVRKAILNTLDHEVRSSAQNGYFKLFSMFRDHWANVTCRDWFSEVLRDYDVPDTTRGGCINQIRICDRTIGEAYFGTIARILNFHDLTDFRRIRTMLIIGGGFGYEVH